MKTIEIQIDGLDFRQDTEPLIKSFYPGLVSEQELLIKLETRENRFSVQVYGESGELLTTESEDVLYSEDTPADSDDGDDDVSEADMEDKLTLIAKKHHREYRNQLLRALYRALGKVSGKSLPWGILTGVRPTKLVLERIERGEAGHLGYMRDTYYCSTEKAALATLVSAKEYQLLDRIDYSAGYSLYIGTPFCPSICNYCSFGSHPIGRFGSLVEPYIEALKKEIAYAATCFPKRRLETVYFGGGTPTSVTAEQLESVIECVKEHFDMSGVEEFTVEAGRPDSVTREKLQMLKRQGVTRISVNPQSMVQRTLDTIGRRHTTQDVIDAFTMAREEGFDNINMDLIAGLSGEAIEDFRYTLAEIEKLDPDSLTVHTLAHKRAARLTTEAELYAGLEATDVPRMVEEAAIYAKAHGYEPYYLYRQKNMTDNLENVGYAKPGKEGLYNVLIMEEKQIILALGAGASSKFVRGGDKRFERVENVKSVAEYIDRIDEMIERKRTYIAEHGIE